MQTVLSIILVIGVLIFVHELGHLLVAKRAGILCREFAIGFGPKLFQFTKNETLYTIRLLPLGGYVRMAGEEPEMIKIRTGHDVALVLNKDGQVSKIVLNHKNEHPEVVQINVQKVDLEHELIIEGYDEAEQWLSYSVDRHAVLVHDHQEVLIAPYDRQFASKSIGRRFATLFAGPLANFMLALVLFITVALVQGIPQDEPRFGEVVADSAAEAAGFQDGDLVLEVDHEPVASWSDLVQIIQANPERELTFLIERDAQQLEVSVIPDSRESRFDEGEQEGFIGVVASVDTGFFNAIYYGAAVTVEYSTLIFQAVGMLITGTLGLDALAGPVGIIDYTGQAASEGFIFLLNFMAFLSVNLAVLNLLPIPALDGGRLIFLLVEAVRGKPLDPQKEGLVHFIGFAMLMLLILVVTWNDIQRVFFN